MIRLYRFDLDRNVIDVETVSPWILGRAAEGPQRAGAAGDRTQRRRRPVLASTIDFARPLRRLRPGARPPGAPRVAAADPGHGGVLALREAGRTAPRSVTSPDAATTSRSSRSAAATPGLVRRPPPRPARSRQPGVPGLQVPAEGRVPAHRSTARRSTRRRSGPVTPSRRSTVSPPTGTPTTTPGPAWSAGPARAAPPGKTGDDPDEPLATLSLSNDREPQWAMRPLNQEGIATNWAQETPLETWWHLAVVNDGEHTTMYVEGCPVVRNPNGTLDRHHVRRAAVAARRLRVRRQDRPDPARPPRRRPDRRAGAARQVLHEPLTPCTAPLDRRPSRTTHDRAAAAHLGRPVRLPRRPRPAGRLQTRTPAPRGPVRRRLRPRLRGPARDGERGPGRGRPSSRRRRPPPRLPRRRPPHALRLQPRRQVHVLPAGRRASAKYGLDWMVFTEHSNFGHAKYGGRAGARGDPQGACREPAPADLPGPGVVHPGRRARHGLRGARPARGRPAHASSRAPTTASCSATTRAAPPTRTPPATRPTPSRPSSGWPSSAARATWTTSSSSPTTRCGSASTPRTSCGPGGTRPPRSWSAWRARPARRARPSPAGAARPDPRRVREQAVGAVLGRLPGGRVPSRTAASTGRPRRSAACGTRCWPRAACSRSPRTPTTTAPSSTPGERRLAGGRELRQHRQAARPGRHQHPAAGQRLLAGPVQPHPRRCDPLRLPRGDGGPARGPGLGRPRPSARRPRRPPQARLRPRPGRHAGRPAARYARARSSRCT